MNNLNWRAFKNYWKMFGWDETKIKKLYEESKNQLRAKEATIDTMPKKIVSTGDILVKESLPKPPAALEITRLFCLYNGEYFGNIFEIDKPNPERAIRKMLEQEIVRTQKMIENETEQGKRVLESAIRNIENLSIYEIIYENEKLIRKYICNYKEAA